MIDKIILILTFSYSVIWLAFMISEWIDRRKR